MVDPDTFGTGKAQIEENENDEDLNFSETDDINDMVYENECSVSFADCLSNNQAEIQKVQKDAQAKKRTKM